MRRVIIRAHGHLHPTDPVCLPALHDALASAGLIVRCRHSVEPLPAADTDAEDGEAVLLLAGNLLRLTACGVTFPLDEVLDALPPLLTPASAGRLDVIDHEAWTLTRCTIQGRTVTRSTADLNQVLDHSGF